MKIQYIHVTISFLSTLFQLGHTLLGIIRPWFTAICLLISAIALLPNMNQLADSYQLLLNYLPYALGLSVILLGQQFVQGRISFSAINLLLGYGIIQTLLQAPLEQDSVRASFTLLSL